MKQNNNIFEELGRMKNLILTKRGVVISEQFDTSQKQTPFGSYTNPVTVKDDLWASTYKCVPAQTGAKPLKMNDGSTSYQIGQVIYYNNGRKKLADRTMANYNCSTEFKTTNTQQQQQQRQQYLKNVTNYSNEIQKSLGITPTGKLTNTDLDKIISSL
jgi:hypothetical protein